MEGTDLVLSRQTFVVDLAGGNLKPLDSIGLLKKPLCSESEDTVVCAMSVSHSFPAIAREFEPSPRLVRQSAASLELRRSVGGFFSHSLDDFARPPEARSRFKPLAHL